MQLTVHRQTLEIELDSTVLTPQMLEFALAQHYERTRALQHRNLQTAVENVNAVTMRYASRVNKYVQKRDPSMTESETEALDFKPSPLKRKVSPCCSWRGLDLILIRRHSVETRPAMTSHRLSEGS